MNIYLKCNSKCKFEIRIYYINRFELKRLLHKPYSVGTTSSKEVIFNHK